MEFSSTVFLTDSDATIAKKVKRAVTDSGNEIKASDDQPGVKNLLVIQSALRNQSIESIEEDYRGKQYGHLKLETAEIVVNAIRPIRSEIERLMKDPTELDRILKLGAEKASQRAEKTLRSVYDVFGFIRPLK